MGNETMSDQDWTSEDEAKYQAEDGCAECVAIGSHLPGCPEDISAEEIQFSLDAEYEHNYGEATRKREAKWAARMGR